MRHKRSKFEDVYSIYTENGRSSNIFRRTKDKRQNKRLRRRGFSFFTLLLCILLSLGAGFAGAMTALKVAYDKGMFREDITTTENVLCEDPEEEIARPESNPSIYGSAGEDAFAISGVVNKVQDTVVVINVTVEGTSAFGKPITSTGSGSGVVISDEGYILTCNHVVEDATTIKVTLRNGMVYDATLVGSDEASDLAVLKISGSNKFSYATQGYSSHLVAGEQVVAIGNPLGLLGGTVTTGVISATERNVVTDNGEVMTLIQTDAAINSGNSGGGLFNLAGELIGIVNAKYSASGVEGLAFAIPIDSAYPVQLDLMQYGYVRGVVDHGLTLLDITQDNLLQYHYYYGIDQIGVYVVESEYTTALKSKDQILTVNGIEVVTSSDVKKALSNCKVGDTITITADRQGTSVVCNLILQEYIPDRIKDSLK